VPFLWFCLPFKQVSVIDSLSAEESWITWEPGKEFKWMRTPPKDAIMSSPYLHYAGEMNYQTFAERAFGDGIRLIGLRTEESYTRLRVMVQRKTNACVYPIYDWKDTDVWRYIKEQNLYFPEIYMRMYEAGTTRRMLRLCAFFGDGSTAGLQHVAETDPDLWERICQREPNAYMALLYWDSEMFNRSNARRRELEEDLEPKDYKALVEDMLFKNTRGYRLTGDTLKSIPSWRRWYMKVQPYISQGTCKKIYEGLIYGDPKARLRRTVSGQAAMDRNRACGIKGTSTRGIANK
jgi:predicted phosphoadenosine phosphosulfate sulfurtransferase